MTLMTANDELSNRIVKIEQDIKELKTGEYRHLSNKEIAVLYSLCKK